jgi:hypothetical protein
MVKEFILLHPAIFDTLMHSSRRGNTRDTCCEAEESNKATRVAGTRMWV